MALQAHVDGADRIEPRRVDNGVACRPRDVVAARTMAFLAANVPLGDSLRLDVVVHGVAAVARRSRRPLAVLRRIEGGPPIGPHRDVVRPPLTMGAVPLAAER